MKKIMKLEFTAVFLEEPEGGFTAVVEELPGAISYGKTIKEARENIFEAIQLVLESNRDLTEKELTGRILKKEIMCFA